MSAPPEIGIVLPVYNHAAFLGRALTAIAEQSAPPAEVIVVDDASSDDSAEVASSFAPRFRPETRFQVIRNATNLGVNAALNVGLAQVRSPFTLCTAADDWLRPDFIGALSAAASRFPLARLVTSASVEFFEAEDRMVEHGASSESGVWYATHDAFFDADQVERLLDRGPITIPISASIVRTDTLRALGGFDPALKWHADWFVSTAVALRDGFAVVPRHLAVFRIAASSYSGGNVRHPGRQREVCRALSDKLATAPFSDVGRRLLRHPSPVAPFIRHMIPSTLGRPKDWPLALSLCAWWLGQAFKGRRPGPVRRLAERLGFDTAPR